MRKKTDQILKTMFLVLTMTAMFALVFFLGQLWVRGAPDVMSGRTHKGLAMLHPVSKTEEKQETAPLGTVTCYRFALKEQNRDSNLAFFAEHEHISVYLDGELIYRVCPGEDSPVSTPGYGWAIVPIYREDAGKELLVELTPVYERVRGRSIEFYLGSEFALLYSQLRWNTVPLAMCGMLVLTGLMIHALCVYWLIRGKDCLMMLSLGVAALAQGFWRLLENRFMLLIVPEQPVFLSYLSLCMMMMIAVPLAISLKRSNNQFSNITYGVFALGSTLILIGQLGMELFGPVELFQMLPLTHGIMIVGVALILVNTLVSLSRRDPEPFSPRKLMPLVWRQIWCMSISVAPPTEWCSP